MLDFLVEVLLTPGPAWIGLLVGIVAASGAWFLLPESVDRISLGGWLIGGGFLCGLAYAFVTRKA